MIQACQRLVWLVALATVAFVLVAPAAFAQGAPPELRLRLSSDHVGTGEAFVLTLDATVSSGSSSPSDPRLSLPAGISATPPSISTRSQVSIVNGRVTQSTGISVSWRLIADRTGTFTIPGPSVAWEGKRVQARSVKVTVDDASPRSQPRAQRANPFDPFGALPQLPGLFELQPPPEEPAVPPELRVDVAPDPYVFFRAVADKESAVVGEQVTLTVYLYSRTRVEWTDVHEPALSDFFRRDLMQPGAVPETHRLLIGGVPWRAQAVFRAAIFPLKTGDLDVGKQRASIVGFGHGQRGGVVHESQPLRIRVTEPPADSRPPGYQLGDVGSYSMTASVEPRTVEQGGAVAVTLTLSGTGNVPPAVRVPMQPGIEWLDPHSRESFEIERGKVRGSRTFSYIVRPKVAGRIDLGEITLPYWDPERQRYETARAPLGLLHVKAVDGVEASEALPANDPFSTLGGPRTSLSPFFALTKPITDSRTYWLGIFGAPLAVLLVSSLARGVHSVRARMSAKRASAASALEQAFDDAKAAQKAGDGRQAASAIDRAIYLSVELATGLKARALLLDEIPAALEARGIEAALAQRVRELLASVEAIRFAPDDALSNDDLLAETRAVCRALRQTTKGVA